MTTDRNSERRVARLLLALDSARPNEAVLRAVSELLETDGLELTALYVDDEDLHRAASLPGFTEISFPGRATSLDAARIAREVARESEAARGAFENLARRLARHHVHFRHRFLVTRGHTGEELERAAAEFDFVMVSRTLRAPGMRARHAHAFLRLVRQPKHMLFVNEPWESGTSVVALAGSQLALRYARRLADAQQLRLVIAAPDPAALEQIPPTAEIRQLADLDEETVAELCLKEDARLLVVPERRDIDCAELLISLMDKLPCSLLKLAGGKTP